MGQPAEVPYGNDVNYLGSVSTLEFVLYKTVTNIFSIFIKGSQVFSIIVSKENSLISVWFPTSYV